VLDGVGSRTTRPRKDDPVVLDVTYTETTLSPKGSLKFIGGGTLHLHVANAGGCRPDQEGHHREKWKINPAPPNPNPKP
jgi:hypothetical protein